MVIHGAVGLPPTAEGGRVTAMQSSLAGVLILALSACSDGGTSVGGAGGSGGSGVPQGPDVNLVFMDSVVLSSSVCLHGKLALDANTSGLVKLAVASPAPCDCSTTNRGAVDACVTAALHTKLASQGTCASADCQSYCVCQLLPASGSALDQCLTQPDPQPPLVGWCYIDPDQGLGSADLLGGCGTSREFIRVLGTSPVEGESWFFVMESGSCAYDGGGVTS